MYLGVSHKFPVARTRKKAANAGEEAGSFHQDPEGKEAAVTVCHKCYQEQDTIHIRNEVGKKLGLPALYSAPGYATAWGAGFLPDDCIKRTGDRVAHIFDDMSVNHSRFNPGMTQKLLYLPNIRTVQ